VIEQPQVRRDLAGDLRSLAVARTMVLPRFRSFPYVSQQFLVVGQMRDIDVA
jgi:hypothetical protein